LTDWQEILEMVKHIHRPNGNGSLNFALLKIQDGGRPPSCKIEQEAQLSLRDLHNALYQLKY